MEKAGLIAMVRVRQLAVDEHFSLRGKTLEECIRADKEKGLIPFFVREVFSLLNIEEVSLNIYSGIRHGGNNILLFVR